MAENQGKNNNNSQRPYHVTAQMTRSFFSYKKPADGHAYSFVYIQMQEDFVTLKFQRGITSENVLMLNCYLAPAKLFDFSRLLEGYMARRREAYAKGDPYNVEEYIKMPITKMRDGQDVNVGSLMVDTEMCDGIPRVRLSYKDFEKNDTIEIVFNTRIPAGLSESSVSNTEKLDFADIDAYDFTIKLKELQNPMVPLTYRIVDAATKSICSFVKTLFDHGTGGKPGYQRQNYQSTNDSQSPQYRSQPRDSDPYDMDYDDASF